MKRFAGIDIGSERHVVAVVDEHGTVLVKPSPFGEEAAGYRRVAELLGSPEDCLIAMVRWTRSSRQRSGDRKVGNPAQVCISLC